ncbi:poly-gamma-glutamate synthase PgsB [Leptospira ilyithenensis]|uniref:Poly-gamma-glutamate synthase PgsB n=1 Tax=Leptospira ilyithenensis TaxID=2484901 RepID=A0A4R9LNL6_9LEPT|nr:poly-gamma-glutamate synthase PgsB [Leptospira ilyithenensis]TGN06811.1 poly-gamma-glutamate synthase PgsB [Leptospira ilyithenensis]
MKSNTILFFVLISLLLFYYLIELLIHRMTLSGFRNRIHVNGTRGKSSITRLIRAGLAANGERVFAKTTGTLARMILPDGTERAVHRFGRPSILEQISILKAAKKENATSIVIECMALEPRYQWASEGMILKSTIGVISNIREDHLDVMGPNLDDVAHALASTIPIGGKLITGETKFKKIIGEVCKDRKTDWIEVSGTSSKDFLVTDAEIARFSYWEHKENVAIALKVCQELGVSRDVAFQAMISSEPDPGALTVLPIQFFGKDILFINAMAANDTESTRMIWNEAKKRYSKDRSGFLLFHCREDRLERSKLLAQEIAKWADVNAIFLIGAGTKYAMHYLKKECKEGMRVFNWEDYNIDLIFESLVAQMKPKSFVLGLGNIAGMGLELTQYLKNRAKIDNRNE